jgi:hypothetical protein
MQIAATTPLIRNQNGIFIWHGPAVRVLLILLYARTPLMKRPAQANENE